MRQALLSAGAGLLLALAAAPLAAQDLPPPSEPIAADGAPDEDFVVLSEEEEELANFEQEMTAAFAMLGGIFKTEPLSPEQEARVPLGQAMAGFIMPAGSFATAMNETMQPMMTMIMGTITENPRIRLAEISGVSADELAALGDAEAQEALDIFDPQFAVRTQRTSDIMVTMIARLLEAVEPSYREAMARALAVRFDAGEMQDLLAFFATPVGGKFAQQSFLVHYDSRMMGVMEAMGPAFVTIMPEMLEELTAIETELGTARDFTELSAAERARAARLIGRSVSELDALVPEYTEERAEGDAVT